VLPACELEVGAGEGAVAGGDAGESEPEEPEVFVTASYAFPAAFDIESSVFFMVVGTDLMPSQTNFAKSFAPFDFGNNWFIEPTVGVSYTQVFAASFGTQTGDSTQVSGGARFGGDTAWYGVKVQPSLTLEAFSIVEQTTSVSSGTSVILGPGGSPIVTSGGSSSGGIPTGAVGGRASGKLNILWTPTFSSFFEAHGSVISSTDAYGVTAGLRWTF
jgi:hypothetical protein